MTRWARSGNTQKHCKQPEDPTPWKELSEQKIISRNDRGIYRKRKNFDNNLPENKQNAGTGAHFPKKFFDSKKKTFNSFPERKNWNQDFHISAKQEAMSEGSIAERKNTKGIQANSPSGSCSTSTMKNTGAHFREKFSDSKKKKKFNSFPERKNWNQDFQMTAKQEAMSEGPIAERKNTEGIQANSPSGSGSNSTMKNTDAHYPEKFSNSKKKKKFKKNQESKNCNQDFQITAKQEAMSEGIIAERKNTDGIQANSPSGSCSNSTMKNTDAHFPEKFSDSKKKKKFKKNQERKNFNQEIHTKLETESKAPEAESENANSLQSNSPPVSVSSPPGKNTVEPKPQGAQKFHDQVKEGRLKNGIPLLPKNVERRIYNMKKALRRKGMPEDTIKETIRHERRKQELAFRKTFKTCFNCRQTGHVLANCPIVKSDTDQGTGICFKCGSAEHTSFKCKVKTNGFPFAKCFICNEIGHLSRNCPKNKNGAYPNGGQCKSCGEIDHLVKDCPQLKKKDGEEELTVDIVDNFASVDNEIDKDETVVMPARKKAKIIKF